MNKLNQYVNKNDEDAQVMREILLNKLEHNELDAQTIIRCTQQIYDLGYASGHKVGTHYAKGDFK